MNVNIHVCKHEIPMFQTCEKCGRQMVDEKPFMDFCKWITSKKGQKALNEIFEQCKKRN